MSSRLPVVFMVAGFIVTSLLPPPYKVMAATLFAATVLMVFLSQRFEGWRRASLLFVLLSLGIGGASLWGTPVWPWSATLGMQLSIGLVALTAILEISAAASEAFRKMRAARSLYRSSLTRAASLRQERS